MSNQHQVEHQQEVLQSVNNENDQIEGVATNVDESVNDTNVQLEGESVDDVDNATNFQRKKRKKVSKVHQDFEDVIVNGGVKKHKCIHCGKLLCMNSSGTTSHLKNQLEGVYRAKFTREINKPYNDSGYGQMLLMSEMHYTSYSLNMFLLKMRGMLEEVLLQ